MLLIELILKLARGNLKKYRLFIVCNVIAIAILLSLRMLLDNPVMNNSMLVDPMISGNVLAPTFFMHVFIIFFVPYTLFILNKQIQKNYGIMMSFGLTGSQYRSCVFAENVIIILISIIIGTVAGNVFEVLLIMMIKRIIGIEQLTVYQSTTVYLQTFIFLLLIYAVPLIIAMLMDKYKDVLSFINADTEAMVPKGSKLWLITAGILTVVSLITGYMFQAKTQGNSILIGIGISFIGITIMIYNSVIILRKIRNKKLFLISDCIYYFKRNRNICVIMVLMYSLILFLNPLSGVLKEELKNDAYAYNPYDISYSQKIGDENIDIYGMSKRCGTEITYESQIRFFYVGMNAVLGADDVNMELGRSYTVPKGSYIFVRNIVLDDGYYHEKNDPLMKLKIGEREYEYYKDIDELLFCRGAGLSDYIILLKQEDFDRIISDKIENVLLLKLLRFNDWRNTRDMILEIKERSIPVSSLYSDYMRAEKSSELLSMLILYISIAFLCSIVITVYYKIKSEREQDEYRYRILQSIGADSKSIIRYKREKLLGIVLIPFVISIVWIGVIGLFLII